MSLPPPTAKSCACAYCTSLPAMSGLDEHSTRVLCPASNYLFVERIGPFMDTAREAWQELHQKLPEVQALTRITGHLALYRVKPEMVYRAAVTVTEIPTSLPSGMRAFTLPEAGYEQFVLTGPYHQLPEACGRVFELIEERSIPLRDDYFVEHYVNDPASTPEAELITHIRVPTL